MQSMKALDGGYPLIELAQIQRLRAILTKRITRAPATLSATKLRERRAFFFSALKKQAHHYSVASASMNSQLFN